MIKGILSASVSKCVASSFIYTGNQLQNKDLVKCCFKIRLDKIGVYKNSGKVLKRKTCMLLYPEELTFRPQDQEVLFHNPLFILLDHNKTNQLN